MVAASGGRAAAFAALSVLGVLVASTPAGAVAIVEAPDALATLAGPGFLSLDPRFDDTEPLAVTARREVGDGDRVAFDAVVDNLGPALWSAFEVSLDRAAFASVGSIGAVFGGIAEVREDAAAVRILLDPPEPFGLDLGDVAGAGSDWEIDVSGLAPGGTFSVRFAPTAVPEPGAAALLLSGLAALSLGRRSRA